MNDLHFALCIGIDRYPGFPGRDLSSATTDALSFRDWLVAPAGGGLPEPNVGVVTVPATEPFGGVIDARPKMHEVLQALNAINERIRSHVAVKPGIATAVALASGGGGAVGGSGGSGGHAAYPGALDFGTITNDKPQ